MHFNRKKFDEIDKTKLTSYLEQIFSYTDNTIEELNKNFLEQNIKLTEDKKNNSRALQIISNLFFQFNGNNLDKEIAIMAIRIYLSHEYISFECLYKFLYIDDDDKLVNIEKEYAIKETIIKIYFDFLNQYNIENKPDCINELMVILEEKIINIKNISE